MTQLNEPVPQQLLADFDKTLVRTRRFASRAEAIRTLMRDFITANREVRPNNG